MSTKENYGEAASKKIANEICDYFGIDGDDSEAFYEVFDIIQNELIALEGLTEDEKKERYQGF